MSIRLIDTTTLRLKVFTGRKVPRYAILSHTWEDDQEVSFQEMTSINKDLDCLAANKTGYVKIVQTCAKAAKHGFRHVWVDTCCIDKTSSAELSEAINSMYKWYKQAEVCYVFLRDFRDDNLSACRWFTRGWCLQELIAPLDLRFYDSDWAYIGSKASLRSAISEITGIEPEVLVDSRLIPTIPIARRMSWASFRDTSREEDIAYCLLGIFDINMPMLYGEGTKAFMRLQEEIIKKSNDLSIFAFDEPRYGQLGLGSWYFDLFAASPDNFRNCTNLVNTTGDVLPRNSFSLTNSGLRFGQVQLKVDVHRAEYILDLGCSKPGVDENLALFLRKADAGIFAKSAHVQHYKLQSSFALGNKFENVEAYITTSITPVLYNKYRRSDELAIRIVTLDTLDTLDDANPSDRWDATRNLFLTNGKVPFNCYLKVHTNRGNLRLARSILKGDTLIEDQEDEHCFLACGLHYRSSYQAHIVPWVRLYSVETWRKFEARIGKVDSMIHRPMPYGLPDKIDRSRDELSLPKRSRILSARIEMTEWQAQGMVKEVYEVTLM